VPYTDVRVLLARNMKRYRKICGISQMALAERVGCSPTSIANIETLKRFPSAGKINMIARSLGIPPSELFAEDTPTLDRMSSASEVRERLESGFRQLLDGTLGDLPNDIR